MDNLIPVTIFCRHPSHGRTGIVTNEISVDHFELKEFLSLFNEDGQVDVRNDRCEMHGIDYLHATSGDTVGEALKTWHDVEVKS